MSKKNRRKKKEMKDKNTDQIEKFDEFHLENSLYYTRIPDSYKKRQAYKPLDEKVLKAFIPGTIRAMKVKVGDIVEVGDKLMVLDAMKMDNDVKVLYGGIIKSVNVKEGEMVKKNQIIVEFE
ncbi:MAG: acetyl-CoA carboxylase biotin carboxyl carrier protein subunit [Bacteroidales bacterium]|nr:acetyl-CoA carboxylase biotin carboxyl carrier protein subunit [Bacteroidales bacterium]